MIINGDGGYSLLDDYIGGPAAQIDWLGPKVSGHLVPFLYSSCKLSELLQWLCYDDSTRNTISVLLLLLLLLLLLNYPMYRHNTQDHGLLKTVTGSC